MIYNVMVNCVLYGKLKKKQKQKQLKQKKVGEPFSLYCFLYY